MDFSNYSVPMQQRLLSALVKGLGKQCAFYCQNREGRIVYISDAALRLLGYREEMPASYRELLAEDPENERSQHAFEAALAGERPEPFETWVFAKDGVRYRWQVTKQGLYDEEEGMVLVYGIVRNLAGEHRFEERMASGEAMLKEAQRLAKLGFLDVDHLNDTVVWSEETYNIFEVEPRSIEGSFEDFLKLVYSEDRDKVAEAYAEAVQSRLPFSVEYRILMADGRVKYLLAEGETRYDASGQPLRTFGTIQDITERHALDYQLKEAQRLAKLGSWNHDLMTKRSLWSEEMYRIYEKDQSEREVSYESIVAPIHPDDRDEFKKAFRDAVEYRKPFVKDYRLLMTDGRIKYLHSQAETTYADDGRPLRIVGTTQDVTERVELQMENERKQQMLFQQSKMAQMGEMLSSIAHQWRQPLAHINSMILEIDMAYDKGALDERTLHDLLDRMERVTDYLSQTIEDFRQYSHPKKEKESFTARELCDDALILFEPLISGRKISIAMQYEGDCPKGGCEIRGYKKEMIQVLLVLLNNAKDALEETQREVPQITIVCDKTSERFSIEVIDNGGGIDPTHMPQIFEPYFSTKENREGTGMGLYLARMIVESSMQGVLRAENREEGAVFTIELPAT